METSLRDWIAELIESDAYWREDVAERFPEDPRNRLAAQALRKAAECVRRLDPDHPGLRKLGEWIDVVNMEFETAISKPEDLSRFGFHGGTGPVTPEEVGALLEDFYLASLARWRESFREADEELPSDVADYIEKELGPDEWAELEVIRNGLRAPARRAGHFPGHLRDAFTDWISRGMPDTVIVGYEEDEQPVGRFLDSMLGCTDILPQFECDELEIPTGSTYGQAAREELARRASGGRFVYVVEDESGRLRWEEDSE